MKLIENAALSHPGRKRRHNEDSYVEAPPLFVVADGMGGAQAGEVASGIVAAAFRRFGDEPGAAGTERLAATIRAANRQIYDRSQIDTQLSGMGTTTTAVLVEGNHLAIGHVGDSRAYRVRDGKLEQLTQDHSLVADLIRSGKLTAAEAETHPQRSVITRALGTDPEVDVDTFTVETRPGDVVLLCSDGLTSMVDDGTILRLVSESASLDDAARALIKAANQKGGDDNITAVLFRIGADDTATIAPPAVPAPAADLEDTLTGLEDIPVSQAPPAPQTAVFRVADVPMWEPPVPEPSVQAPAPAEPPATPAEAPRPRRWLRRLFWFVLAIAIAAAVAGGAVWGLSRAYFVGADEQGYVTVYRGVPWDLGSGVKLYRAKYVSTVLAVQLSPFERAVLFDHSLTGYDKARAKLTRFEQEAQPAQ